MTVLRLGCAAVVALLAGLSTAAAAPKQPEASARAGQEQTEAVLASALVTLRDRHMNAQNPAARVAAGLRGLSPAEPALWVALTPASLDITVGHTRSSFPAPGPDDAARWAAVAAGAIEAATAASPKLRALPRARRTGLVIEEMIAGLDPYSRYVPRAEAKAERASRSGAGEIGLTLAARDGGAEVVAVTPDAPAWRAGVALGDRVIAIDGASTRRLGEAALAEALAGHDGTTVLLTIARRAGPPQTLAILRAIAMPETATLSWHEGVPVIAVTAFTRETDQAVARLVTGLAARQPSPTGLVLDLRGNAGGLLDVAVSVADVFLADGVVASVIGRHEEASRIYVAGGADLAEGMALAVLVDGATGSAAEMLAAALHDLGRGWIIGSATRGKGLIQAVHRLPDGAELHITWAKLFSPAGTPLQGFGVLPDLCTSRGETLARTQAATLLAAGSLEGWEPTALRGSGQVTDSGAAQVSAPGAPQSPDASALDASRAAALRTACPAAQGGQLDMGAALWLLRSSAAPALAPLQLRE